MCAVCIPEGSAGRVGSLRSARSHRCVQPPWPEFSSFHAQPLYFHILIDSASVNPFGPHTSKKSHIYVKTKAFKPFRDTYLHSAFSQSLSNHILNKNGDRGRGGAFLECGGSEPAPSEADGPSFLCPSVARAPGLRYPAQE